jgi:hypothetical protein
VVNTVQVNKLAVTEKIVLVKISVADPDPGSNAILIRDGEKIRIRDLG